MWSDSTRPDDQTPEPKSIPVMQSQMSTSTSYDDGVRAPVINVYPESRPARHGGMRYWVKWLLVTIMVSALIAVPMIVLNTSLVKSDITTLLELEQVYENQWKNLGFWISSWLLVSWVSACVFHAIAKVFPHLFRKVAQYINPAHVRYWKTLFFMKWPITILGFTACSYISFAVLIYSNYDITANYDFADSDWSGFNATVTPETDSDGFDYQIVTIDGFTFNDHDSKQAFYLAQVIINDVLFNIILWAALWFLEKCMILYIAIHYNSRSSFGNLSHSKEVTRALAKLYNVSIYLHPIYRDPFRTDDIIIHDEPTSRDGRLNPAKKLFNLLGTGVEHMTSALGYLVNSDEDSHWFDPQSSYAIVSRAMDHPTAAVALARRIWMSLASKGANTLTVEDIKAALGPMEDDEVRRTFALLDESENGNIRLDEFASTIVGVGKMRQNSYKAVSDMNRSLNTFDWVLCLILAASMIFFILVSWVPQIKLLRDNIALIVVGGAFIVGRIGHEFFAGAIFLFFKHAFDVGDHVRLYNIPETNHVACIVKRMSLLYVIFERVDNKMEMQIPNDRLNVKRIENLTRSGMNREQIDINVDYETTFKDIQYLRGQLSAFLGQDENRRNYRPTVDICVKAVPDLLRIQLQVSFWHKSNWADEELRSARSSKFVCELLRVVRRIPISKPGGSGAKTGDEGKPSYMVTISEQEAAAKRAAEKKKQSEKRIDFVQANGAEKTQASVVEADPSQLSEEELAEWKARKEQEETEKRVAKEKKIKEEWEKEQARLAEMEALRQLTEIPIVERHASASAPWETRDGLRNRYAYSPNTDRETGLRDGEGYQPLYPRQS